MYPSPFGQWPGQGQCQGQGQPQMPGNFPDTSQAHGVWVHAAEPPPPLPPSPPPPPPPPPSSPPPPHKVVQTGAYKYLPDGTIVPMTPEEAAAEEADIPLPPPLPARSDYDPTKDPDNKPAPNGALVRSSSSKALSFFDAPHGSSAYEGTQLAHMPRAGQVKGDGTVESSEFKIGTTLRDNGVQHMAGYSYKMVGESGKHGRAEEWYEKGKR